MSLPSLCSPLLKILSPQHCWAFSRSFVSFCEVFKLCPLKQRTQTVNAVPAGKFSTPVWEQATTMEKYLVSWSISTAPPGSTAECS